MIALSNNAAAVLRELRRVAEGNPIDRDGKVWRSVPMGGMPSADVLWMNEHQLAWNLSALVHCGLVRPIAVGDIEGYLVAISGKDVP